MKQTVELWGMNEEVIYDDEKVFEWAGENGAYEEAAVTEDGRLIGYDEAINAWVQIWHTAAEII